MSGEQRQRGEVSGWILMINIQLVGKGRNQEFPGKNRVFLLFFFSMFVFEMVKTCLDAELSSSLLCFCHHSECL